MSNSSETSVSNRTPPKELAKMENGSHVTLDRKQIYNYNFPNYDEEDIIIESMEMNVSTYDDSLLGNHVNASGTCVFGKNSNIPEVYWEHISSTIFIIVINQGGKAAQNYTSDVNGIALRKFSSNIKKPAPMNDIHFEFNSKIFVKMGMLWVNSNWDFFHAGAKIADFDILSIGVQRDYSKMIEKKGHNS